LFKEDIVVVVVAAAAAANDGGAKMVVECVCVWLAPLLLPIRVYER